MRASNYPSVFFSFGGRLGFPSVGTSAYYLAEEAGKCGCRMMVVSASFDRDPLNASRKISTLEVAGKRIPFRLIGKGIARKLHDYRAASLLEKLDADVDVVHCWPGSSLRTLDIARKLALPALLQRTNAHTAYAYEAAKKEHEKLGIEMPSNYSHSPNPKRLKLEEMEYELADKILVPSDFVYRTFKERGFEDEKLIRMHYGYDPNVFYPVSEDSGKRKKKKFTITFVGRGEPRKGLHYALEAWSIAGLCSRTRFNVVGKLDVIPGYDRILNKWLNHENICILGEISNVADILRQSDVLVLPAVEEGSAKVTYEARACGCVIAVSDCSGAECTHMYDGLIHPAGDVDLLREHLLMLCEDRDLYYRLRENSIKEIENFTWENAGKKLAEIYRNICCSRGG